MRRGDVIRTADDLGALVAQVLPAIPYLLDALEQYRGGYPATASGTAVYGGGSDGSSVERLALTRDPAADARRQLDERLTCAQCALVDLLALVRAWQPTWDKRGAGAGIEGCAWCDDVPAHRTTVAGNIDPTVLCRACTRFVARHGRKPSRGELLRKQAGGRLRAS